MTTSNNVRALDASEDAQQFLSFKLGPEEYGVDILKVQEIKGWEGATPIPNMPPYVLGVINLRGTVVPIINLRDFFNMAPQSFSKTTVVIVVRVQDEDGEAKTIGLVVDAVSEVHNITPDEMRPAPEFGGACDADFIRGLATKLEHMIILLDVDKLIHRGILEDIDETENVVA
jgi:purine-binding chemotaxis protein CheW